MKQLQKLFIALILILFVVDYAKAQDSKVSVEKQSIYPGSVFYSFKRLAEKVEAKLAFSGKSKVKLHTGLLKKRVSELAYLVDNKKITPMENASNRFSYEAGVLTESLEKYEDKESAKQTKQDFKDYRDILAGLRDKFEANSSNWLLLQQNIDTLNILSEKIKD